MKSYNILLLGSGGREAAFAWKLRQSKHCKELFIAPGNAGTAKYGMNLPVAVTDMEAIKQICLENHIDLVLPGGEDALVAGIYDFFQNDPQIRHVIVAGPSSAGAQLEGSKAFAKQFMDRHGIPTAAYREFTSEQFREGTEWIKNHPLPVVIKADGLAAGKGVIIANSTEEALEAFRSMVQEDRFGDAGRKVVVEQFLDGIELSVFALTNGETFVLLPEAKDYKRIGEGDQGPNTGGMGAISPVPFANQEFMDKVVNKVVKPTINGLSEEKIVYKGFVFFGLINVAGEPFVIEYNCRMGDPETEVVMPRLQSDLVELLVHMHEGRLSQSEISFDSRAAATVMLVSEGYPGSYEKGKEIAGLDEVQDSVVFHAGTANRDETVVTSGGRVIALTSFGETLKDALGVSYKNADLVSFEGKYFRRDIGYEFL